MDINKDLLGAVSVVFTFISVAPYFYFILKGTIKPHAFSWCIWALLTGIGYMAAYTAGAGPGAWSTLAACMSCSTVALLACFKGERDITKPDWWCFIAALLAIPLWLITKNPLWSVILISIIDVLGYYPTMRKSYHRPREELIFTHLVGVIKYIFALMALENWTLTTWLYPLAICIANIALVVLILTRRAALYGKH